MAAAKKGKKAAKHALAISTRGGIAENGKTVSSGTPSRKEANPEAFTRDGICRAHAEKAIYFRAKEVSATIRTAKTAKAAILAILALAALAIAIVEAGLSRDVMTVIGRIEPICMAITPPIATAWPVRGWPCGNSKVGNLATRAVCPVRIRPIARAKGRPTVMALLAKAATRGRTYEGIYSNLTGLPAFNVWPPISCPLASSRYGTRKGEALPYAIAVIGLFFRDAFLRGTSLCRLTIRSPRRGSPARRTIYEDATAIRHAMRKVT